MKKTFLGSGFGFFVGDISGVGFWPFWLRLGPRVQ